MWTGHPLTTHICAVQSVHKRGTHRTRLAQELHNIFVRLRRICHLVCTCLTLCCSRTCRSPRAHHLPHSLSLLTKTQEHAAQPVQHGHRQEHPVHHAHLHALPVDKQHHQESLWRGNLQSGGKPRTTTPTLKTQDTVQKGQEPSYTRLNDMVRRFLDQKLTDRNFDARRDDETAQGAAVKRSDGKRRSRERKQGDCSRWRSKGQCSKGDSCNFKHDEHERGKGTTCPRLKHFLLKETAKVPRASAHRAKETSQFATS